MPWNRLQAFVMKITGSSSGPDITPATAGRGNAKASRNKALFSAKKEITGAEEAEVGYESSWEGVFRRSDKGKD